MGVSRLQRILYSFLILLTIVASFNIYQVVTNPFSRQTGYLYWEGIISIFLLSISILLMYKYYSKRKDANGRNGSIILLAIQIFNILVMLLFASSAEFTDNLSFYFHLSIMAGVLTLVSVIGNIIGAERKDEEGFFFHIHDNESNIPWQSIIPVWIAVFLIMGGVVIVTGRVFVQYPSLGILSNLGGPIVTGFGVGDWENIVFILLPFSLTFLFLRRIVGRFFKVPTISAFLIALLVAASSFTAYHAFVYTANMIALLMVLLFGLIGIFSYYLTKSQTILSAFHVGNNFWGLFFNANVVTFAAFGVQASVGSVLSTGALAGVAIILIVLYFRRRSGKRRN